MGVYIDPCVILEIPCSTKNIAHLIRAGASCGFSYWIRPDFENWQHINIEQAIELSCDLLDDSIEDTLESFMVYGKYEDTYVGFRIEPLGLYTTKIYFFVFLYRWKRSFLGDVYDIDLNRYFRLLFAVCQDFPILSFHIEVW